MTTYYFRVRHSSDVDKSSVKEILLSQLKLAFHSQKVHTLKVQTLLRRDKGSDDIVAWLWWKAAVVYVVTFLPPFLATSLLPSRPTSLLPSAVSLLSPPPAPHVRLMVCLLADMMRVNNGQGCSGLTGLVALRGPWPPPQSSSLGRKQTQLPVVTPPSSSSSCCSSFSTLSVLFSWCFPIPVQGKLTLIPAYL